MLHPAETEPNLKKINVITHAMQNSIFPIPVQTASNKIGLNVLFCAVRTCYANIYSFLAMSIKVHKGQHSINGTDKRGIQPHSLYKQ